MNLLPIGPIARLLLALLVAALVAAACAGSNSGGGETTNPPVTDANEQADSNDGDSDSSDSDDSDSDDSDSDAETDDESDSDAEPDSQDTGDGVDVFAFANGCYALVEQDTGNAVQASEDRWVIGSGTEQAAPFTMQATALGRYLLYGPGGSMIVAADGDAISGSTDPGPSADWTVADQGDGLTLTNLESDSLLAIGADQELTQSSADEARWTFAEATGCEAFPDISPGVTGEPFVGESPDAAVRGFLDAHTHVSAFSFLGGSFHCGTPWSPYGVTVALVDCPSHMAEGDGLGQLTESIFSHGTPEVTHETDGWPTFVGWPKPDSLTHEGTYWRWIERSWRGGLRILVNHLVDNRALCETYPENDGTVCNDMANARDQAADMVAMQDYIDAQFGGPGKGFFRIAHSSQEARRIINDGKLAVVLGVEVSEVLDCGIMDGTPACDEAQIDAGLDELFELGVRTVFPVHKFDNALGGTKYDPGLAGTIVNSGNQRLTGEWWDPQTCAEGETPDNTVVSLEGTFPVVAQVVGPLFGEALVESVNQDLPTYGAEPHCNPKGLSDLGAYAVNGLIDRNMIVETDHMSARARSEALDVLERRQYSGVISSHGWGDVVSQVRISALGGVNSPYAGGGFIGSWRLAKEGASEDYLFGIGFGTDTNGLGGQPQARGDAADNPVVYPYETFDGGTVMDRQVSGDKTYDVNIDGVAHYGLFPDWIEDMRVVEGPEIVEDLAQGAEAYLQMWERAEQHTG